MVVRISVLQSSFNALPSRPRMSMRVSAPVPASNPVARMMTSSLWTVPSAVCTPSGVTRSIGLSLTPTIFDIGTMEGFQEVLFERHAVRSEAVVGRGRNQQFAQLWILQPLAHLLAHEFRYLPVDLLVEEHLSEGGEPQLQRTVVPAVFQHLATPSGREIGPGMFEIILEAGERTG